MLRATPPPFAIIHRPERTGASVQVFLGDVTEHATLADIPLPELGPGAGSGDDVLVVVPYRQIAERGFEQFEGWVADTAELLAGCPCERGCPSCVQSPKCGNLNEYLDKAGALTLLTRMSNSG